MKRIAATLLIMCVGAVVSCERGDKTPLAKRDVVAPLVAGAIYPSDPAVLSPAIRALLATAPDMVFGENTLGFMTPHAGYAYSGPIMAYIFKNLPQNRYKKIVIIFPSHFGSFRGILAFDKDAMVTPLGEVEIARDDIKKLIAADPSFFWKEGIYTREYGCEILLPLLQERLGKSFKIIPLMWGDQSPNMARRLAEILEKNIGTGPDVLYIASTDMSHNKPYETANALDVIALNQIASLDADALAGDMGSGRAELCGYGSVLTLMYLSKNAGAEKARILKHMNSGDTTGNLNSVVGYGAVQFYKK